MIDLNTKPIALFGTPVSEVPRIKKGCNIWVLESLANVDEEQLNEELAVTLDDTRKDLNKFSKTMFKLNDWTINLQKDHNIDTTKEEEVQQFYTDAAAFLKSEGIDCGYSEPTEETQECITCYLDSTILDVMFDTNNQMSPYLCNTMTYDSTKTGYRWVSSQADELITELCVPSVAIHLPTQPEEKDAEDYPDVVEQDNFNGNLFLQNPETIEVETWRRNCNKDVTFFKNHSSGVKNLIIKNCRLRQQLPVDYVAQTLKDIEMINFCYLPGMNILNLGLIESYGTLDHIEIGYSGIYSIKGLNPENMKKMCPINIKSSFLTREEAEAVNASQFPITINGNVEDAIANVIEHAADEAITWPIGKKFSKLDVLNAVFGTSYTKMPTSFKIKVETDPLKDYEKVPYGKCAQSAFIDEFKITVTSEKVQTFTKQFSFV